MNEQHLNKLLQSVTKREPINTEEISLVDKFILSHSGSYQLPGSIYKNILLKILENRINNSEWQEASTI